MVLYLLPRKVSEQNKLYQGKSRIELLCSEKGLINQVLPRKLSELLINSVFGVDEVCLSNLCCCHIHLFDITMINNFK